MEFLTGLRGPVLGEDLIVRYRFLPNGTVRLLQRLRNRLLRLRTWSFRTFYGMDLSPDVRVSFKARLDKTNPRALTIGSQTYVAFAAIILTHDFSTARFATDFDGRTTIGAHCFIGAGSIILPGVTVGDHSVVGAGAVVSSDVPACSLVVGNPARVVRTGIMTQGHGVIIDRGQPVRSDAA